MAPSPEDDPARESVDVVESAEVEETVGARVPGHARSVRRSVRPPADPALQARARHHRCRTVDGDRMSSSPICAQLGPDEELEEASEFLVVAATLLDMKVAGLLPQGELVDAEVGRAARSARPVVRALLQYRAFKQVSTWFATRLQAEDRRHTRAVRLDEQYRKARARARLDAERRRLRRARSAGDDAARDSARRPRPPPRSAGQHPRAGRRRRHAAARGRRADLSRTRDGVAQQGVVVARFLSVLELYRHAALSFEQVEPLGELTLRWTAERWSDENLATLGADYDR